MLHHFQIGVLESCNKFLPKNEKYSSVCSTAEGLDLRGYQMPMQEQRPSLREKLRSVKSTIIDLQQSMIKLQLKSEDHRRLTKVFMFATSKSFQGMALKLSQSRSIYHECFFRSLFDTSSPLRALK